MIRQFARFCVTGTINATIDFSCYLLLTRLFDFWSQHLVTASITAFILASTNSYFMNKYWTFRDRLGKHHIQYPKFITVSVISLLISAGCFYMLVHAWHFNDILSKVIVAAIVLFWNFTINKLWTFVPAKVNAESHAV